MIHEKLGELMQSQKHQKHNLISCSISSVIGVWKGWTLIAYISYILSNHRNQVLKIPCFYHGPLFFHKGILTATVLSIKFRLFWPLFHEKKRLGGVSGCLTRPAFTATLPLHLTLGPRLVHVFTWHLFHLHISLHLKGMVPHKSWGIPNRKPLPSPTNTHL